MSITTRLDDGKLPDDDNSNNNNDIINNHPGGVDHGSTQVRLMALERSLTTLMFMFERNINNMGSGHHSNSINDGGTTVNSNTTNTTGTTATYSTPTPTITTSTSSYSSSSSIPNVKSEIASLYTNSNNSNSSGATAAATTSATMVPATTAAITSFTSRLPTRVVLPVLADVVNVTVFRAWKEDILQVLLEYGLSHYFELPFTDVCSMVSMHHPHVPLTSIQLHVKTQSGALTAALRSALGSHWGRFNDMMGKVATEPANVANGAFIKNNVYWLWDVVVLTFETVSKFAKVKILSQLFTVKHVATDAPTVTLEKLMVIKRQLVAHKYTVDDSLLAAVLYYSIPDSMSSIKQSLLDADDDSIDHIFNTMQRFYDAKINAPSTNTINSKVTDLAAGTAKAFTFNNARRAGICYKFAKGNCSRENCPYSHDIDNINSKGGAGSGVSQKSNSNNTTPGYVANFIDVITTSTGSNSAGMSGWTGDMVTGNIGDTSGSINTGGSSTSYSDSINTGGCNSNIDDDSIVYVAMFTDCSEHYNYGNLSYFDAVAPEPVTSLVNVAATTSSDTTAPSASIEHVAAVQAGLDHLHFNRSDEAIFDTGASRHVVRNKKRLINIRAVAPVPMVGATDKIMFVKEVGDFKISKRLTLSNTLYVPTATTNLVSAGKILDAGLLVKLYKTKALIIAPKTDEVLLTFIRIGGVWSLKLESTPDIDGSDGPGYTLIKHEGIPRKIHPVTPITANGARNALIAARAASAAGKTASTATTGAATTTTSTSGIAATSKAATGTTATAPRPTTLGTINDVDIDFVECYAAVTPDISHARLGHYGQHADCITCIVAKGKKAYTTGATTRIPAAAAFDRLHMDLVGPMSTVIDGVIVPVPTISGKRYALVVVDEKSRYTFVVLLAAKSDAKTYIINIISLIKRQYNHQVKQIHSDRGGEFLGNILKTYFDSNGIIHTTTPAETPHDNGLAERMNGVLVNTSKSIMLASNAPVQLWGEGMVTASYLHVRTPLTALQGKTAYEKVNGTAPPVKRLRVWGCDAYVTINKHGKFDAAKVPGIFVGYCEQQYAYRILLPTGMIRISRDVTFIENQFNLMKRLNDFINGNASIGTSMINGIGATGVSTSDTIVTTTGPTTIGVSPAATTTVSATTTASVANTTATTSGMIEIDGINGATDSGTITNNTSHYNDISFDLDQSLHQNSDSEFEFEEKFGDSTDGIVEDGVGDGTIASGSIGNFGDGGISDSESTSGISDINGTSDDTAPSLISAEDLTPVVPPSVTGKRARHAPGFYSRKSTDNYYKAETAFQFEDLTRLTYKQAMKRTDSLQWSVAVKKELDSLIAQDVGTEVSPTALPTDVKPLTCRLLFKIKYDDQNKPIQHKARLVVQGFKQVHGIDYNETFAPTAKSKSIKLMLSDAAINDKELKQFDVDTAFLNAKLKETVYIILPDGCGELTGKIWKLNKALYGLKQAPNEWNGEIDATLVSLGYVATRSDPCIYVKRIGKQVIIIYLYVDDAVISYHISIQNVWYTDFNIIKTKYKIKDLGNCEWILNMKVIRDRTAGTIKLSQEAYIKQLLIDHNMCIDNIKMVDNPCDPALGTVETHAELLNEKQHHIYRSIIGGISYAAQMTRSDIAFATGMLSRYLAAPTQQHMNGAKRVLRYLAATAHYSMLFTGTDHSKAIAAYTDASWGNDMIDRKSTTGTLIKVFGNNCCWNSKKQKCVALSSTEAEYYAMSSTVCDALWVKQWLFEVTGANYPIVVYCDNQSAIHLSAHDSTHQRSKHIDIKYHFLRDHIIKNNIIVKWIPTGSQQADMLTKAMVTKQFESLVRKNLYF